MLFHQRSDLLIGVGCYASVETSTSQGPAVDRTAPSYRYYYQTDLPVCSIAQRSFLLVDSALSYSGNFRRSDSRQCERCRQYCPESCAYQQTIPSLPAKRFYASDGISELDFIQITQTAAALDSVASLPLAVCDARYHNCLLYTSPSPRGS